MDQRPAEELLLATDRGPARVLLTHPRGTARAVALLLHGAGSGVDSGVLPQLAAGLAEAGVAVAALDQPYRVAGRRAPDRAPLLDGVVVEVLAGLRAAGWAPGLPLLVAGRSSGARVGCRTRGATGALAVAALGFPLRPPARRPGRVPAAEVVAGRAEELATAGRCGPVLVVQGRRDPFGCPAVSPGVAVVVVAGGHLPLPAAAELAGRWLVAQLVAWERGGHRESSSRVGRWPH